MANVTEKNMFKDFMMKDMSMSNHRGGHLYMQTNEVKNCIMHYHRSANGALTEVERVATGGAGSGEYKPISDQASPPSCADRALFATNFGYSNLSTFHIDCGEITVAKDPACPKARGDGTARGICGDITSGPSDSWVSPD